MKGHERITVLAAACALDNERESYEYRCKLARTILDGLISDQAKEEPPGRLQAKIDSMHRLTPQIEKKLYTLMEIYSIHFKDACPLDDILSHCTELAEVAQLLDALCAEWEDVGAINQTEIDFSGVSQ